MSAQDSGIQTPVTREIPIFITSWEGMMSAFPLTHIPINAFSYLLNMDFVNQYVISSRKGTSQVLNNTTQGEYSILEGFMYKRRAVSTVECVFANANGNLYTIDPASLGTPTLIGSLSNSTPTVVNMGMLKGKLYIASGGADGQMYNGSTLTNVTIANAGNLIDVTRVGNRMVFADEGSIFGSDINDPDTYTGGDSFEYPVAEDDGMDISSITNWGKSLLVSKYQSETHQSATYWLRGSTVSDFIIDPLYSNPSNPAGGLVGKSAVQIGSDVIALTIEGFVSLKALQTFLEARLSVISQPIVDIIRRINFDMGHIITAIFDPITQQYMCAVPLDGAVENTHVIIYDPNFNRWGLYNNWRVGSWIQYKTNLWYGAKDGQIIQTRIGNNDLGNAYSKIAESGNIHFGAPDVIKLFKSIQSDLTHDGDYEVNVIFVLDDFESAPLNVPLKLDARSSLWDVFVFDVDYWDIEGSTQRTVYVMGRAKTLRTRFQNENADEPFSLRTMTYRMVPKDSGSITAQTL